VPTARHLVIAALALLLLPFVLSVIGLGVTSATEVVVFSLACMALNILVGYTGLTSFGHGAWFGLAAYAAGMSQRDWFAGSFFMPLALGLAIVVALAAAFGFLILRRRGVYFSLLTLALSAMLYSVAFRWTDVTGGENGLGGITRPVLFGVSFEGATSYYALVAGVAFVALLALWRFHRSPLGSVLVAIRENEQRAQFIGYPTNRYKLVAFTLSATLTGLAGCLLLFNNRMTSADPISVAFSGELLAMVVIGGMRSFMGPALGALFFVIFRDYLSGLTENWLLWFGLLFVGFVLFSPTGLVGVADRVLAPFRKTVVEAAAMAGRRLSDAPLPDFLMPASHVDGLVLKAEGMVKHFGGIKAVEGLTFAVRDRTLHALIGPNGAGKTTAFNLVSGMFPPNAGTIRLGADDISGLPPDRICRAGIGRSFQITNLFPTLSIEENIRLAVQARHPRRFDLDSGSGKDVPMNPADVAQSALPLTSSDLSLFTLFWHAHWIVKAVMLGLLASSIWVWAIVIDKTVLYARNRRAMDAFEQTFWSGQSLEELYRTLSSKPNHSMAALFVAAGMPAIGAFVMAVVFGGTVLSVLGLRFEHAADATGGAVVVARADSDGVGTAGTFVYPVPGAVQALAVGNLNSQDDLQGDEDIVAVSVNPAVLSVLIATPQESVKAETAPFHYTYGGFVGEDQPGNVNIESVALGATDQGRFLATTAPGNKEILVVPVPKEGQDLGFLPAGQLTRIGVPERFVVSSLETADLDQMPGDDVIVTGSDGRILLLLARAGDELAFVEQEPIDLSQAQTLPIFGRSLRTRFSYPVHLDGNLLPDIVLPVRVLARGPSEALPADNFVAVILNPGAGNPEIRVFQTLAGPRQAVAANLNGDGALDLVVASEGANKVHVLFGDPGAPGSFVDSPTDDRSALRSVELPGFTGESEPEIEFVWTDNQALGFDKVAEVIIASSTTKVSVYVVRPGMAGGPVEFEGPCHIYGGFDPETLALADVLGDEGLELLIADEDLGQIVLLENVGFHESDCSPWVERARLPISGSPSDFVLFHHAENTVVVSTTNNSWLETYAIPDLCREPFLHGLALEDEHVPVFEIDEGSADGDGTECFISPGPKVELVEALRRGGPAGLSAARSEDGLLVASVVEDAGPGKGAVDLVSFRSGLSPGDLRSFFSPAADSSTTRLEWEGPEMDAVILGHFSGDDALVDLIGHTVSGGFLLFPRIDRAAPTVPQPTVISFSGHPLGDLLDLERVEMSSGPDLFLAATGTEVCLLDAGGGCTVIRSSAGTIASVACGWSGVPRDRSHLNVAVLDGGKLFVGSFESLKEKNTPLATADVSAIVGCRDLNDDGADDVVLVDGSSVRVFLARKGGVFKEVGVPPAAPLAAFRFANQIEPLELAFLDANGDSRTDVCIGTSRGDVHILLGDGRGAFPVDRASVVFAGPDLEGIWTADLDGDGRDDVLASVGVPGLVILRSRVRGESSSALGGE
jgi:ABC-type branched-subunit amino acid transport system permease subunit